MYVWPDGQVTGSVHRGALEPLQEAISAGKLPKLLDEYPQLRQFIPEHLDPADYPVLDLRTGTGFDPSTHTVAEVNEYLAAADDEEKADILAAEAAGKARVGIVGSSDGDDDV